MNADSLGCFLLSPDANLSWTDAQLFCERVKPFPLTLWCSVTQPAGSSISFFYSLSISSIVYIILCKGRGLHGRTTNPSAGLNFLFISRHFYRYRSTTFCFSCSYILTHHYQASLLSSLVNLLSSETSIKHWWLERIILLTCFSWNMATLWMIYVIHRLWTKTDMKMVSAGSRYASPNCPETWTLKNLAEILRTLELLRKLMIKCHWHCPSPYLAGCRFCPTHCTVGRLD